MKFIGNLLEKNNLLKKKTKTDNLEYIYILCNWTLYILN